MYRPTAYIYPTKARGYESDNSAIPGRADLVLAYPSSARKSGEMTFTFEGRTSKQIRKVMALLTNNGNPRPCIVGDEQTAAFLA